MPEIANCAKLTINLPTEFDTHTLKLIAKQCRKLVDSVDYILAYEKGENGKLHFHLIYRQEKYMLKPQNEKRKFRKIFDRYKLKMVRPMFDLTACPHPKYRYDGFKYQVGYCQKEDFKKHTNLSPEDLQICQDFYIKNHVVIPKPKTTYTTLNSFADEIVKACLDGNLVWSHLTTKMIVDNYIRDNKRYVPLTVYDRILKMPLYEHIRNFFDELPPIVHL